MNARSKPALFVVIVSLVLSAFAAANSSASDRFVNLTSTNPVPPYTTWSTAATSVQEAVAAAKLGTVVVPRLLTTFTNPTSSLDGYFGRSVAALGTDQVLIGAYGDDTGASNAGTAYLFSTSGSLITTFTNPTPVVENRFGWPVAAVGTDLVLIGAAFENTGEPAVGVAYLFSTNGALLTTFTNPTPAASDLFGLSFAAVGTGRVLIGAYLDDAGAFKAGAAYLFSTNGTLLTTFTNPTPATFDSFGLAVAAVGNDRVVIGTYRDDAGAFKAGAAYLFSTNGALLTTFTNPTPAAGDSFGLSVGAVGTDRVLIGASSDDTGATNAGAAYLISLDGTLLTTFVKPTSVAGDGLGSSVAAVGTDRVLIAAVGDDTGATDAGAAYLFSTNGALLMAFANPTPATGDYFGSSMSAVGTNLVLIGAYKDDTVAHDAGAAYLFSLEPFTPEAPFVSISVNHQLSTLTVSWPVPADGWVLECTNALPSVAVASWPQVPLPYQTNAETIAVTFTNLPAAENQFFRLRKP